MMSPIERMQRRKAHLFIFTFQSEFAKNDRQLLPQVCKFSEQ